MIYISTSPPSLESYSRVNVRDLRAFSRDQVSRDQVLEPQRNPVEQAEKGKVQSSRISTI